MSYVPRLKEFYKKNVVSKLKDQFEYSSIMEVPKLEKIVINQGLGDATQDKKVVENALKELTILSGCRKNQRMEGGKSDHKQKD